MKEKGGTMRDRGETFTPALVPGGKEKRSPTAPGRLPSAASPMPFLPDSNLPHPISFPKYA